MTKSRAIILATLLLSLLLGTACRDPKEDEPFDLGRGDCGRDSGGEAFDLGRDGGPDLEGDLGGEPGRDEGVDLELDAGEEPPIPRVGAEETLEVATWNLRNFPMDGARTLPAVAELVDGLQIDLIALQEIEDVESFDQLDELLEEHEGIYSADQYGPGNYQKTGLLYRSSQIELLRASSIFRDESWAFPRPPLQAELRLTPPEGEARGVIVIVVHLKAQVGESNEDRRRAACEALALHLDELQGRGHEDVLVLGDFNDELGDPAQDNVFTSLLEQPERGRFLTVELDRQGEISYIPYPRLIDHLLVSPGWEARYPEARTEVLKLDHLQLGYVYTQRVSDHRPVVGVFTW